MPITQERHEGGGTALTTFCFFSCPRQALIAPMKNAKQPSGPPSRCIAEEVYVSVTAYSREVRAAISRAASVSTLTARDRKHHFQR